MHNQDKIYNVVVIGAGPAGISCAIQLKKYGIAPLIFEKNRIGGLLRNANLVENYPGFPDGLSGRELADKFRVHLGNAGLSPLYEKVCEVDFNKEFFTVKTGNTDYKSKILVIASGTMPKKPDIDVQKDAENQIYYEVCGLCKKQVKDKKVVIIGSGDAAFDYALNLAENFSAKTVVILNRSYSSKCLRLLKERAFKNEKIVYLENREAVKIEKFLDKSAVICTNGDRIEADYLLFAIGREPYKAFLNRNLTEIAEELKNKKRLFLIGDVKNGIFRQTAISAGDGIRAAMEIHKEF